MSLVSYTLRMSASEQTAADTSSTNSTLSFTGDQQDLPDVYFIVLDTYTRGDALIRDFGYDNSAFLEELRSMEFYIADCSRSNYEKTQGSLIATLNLNYLPALVKRQVRS